MKLEIDNVELYFKQKQILKGIYLKAETGSVTAVLGRNGCGKSVLFKILFGSLRAKSKLIRVNNTAVLRALFTVYATKLLPQHALAPRHLKVKKLFQMYEVDWGQFIQNFEGFDSYQNLRFRYLSGGQQRLIEAYLVLMSPGKIVILDEPFSGLAPIHAERLATLITQEKTHKVILISDHRYDMILDLADDIYLIKNGCSYPVKDEAQLRAMQYLP